MVIGFSGVTWNEITKEHTPNLYAFGHSHASANIVTRSVHGTTCPVEGWLTVNAGQRALDPRNVCALPVVAEGQTIPQWAHLKEKNSFNSYGAQLGLLGEILQKENISSLIIGEGAAFAVADTAGQINGTYIKTAPLPGSVQNKERKPEQQATTPSPGNTQKSNEYKGNVGNNAVPQVETEEKFAENDAPTPAEAYVTSANAAAKLTVIDLGAVRYPDDQLVHNGEKKKKTGSTWKQIQASFGKVPETPVEVYEQLTELDRQFGEIINKTPKNTRIIVMSVGDSQSNAAQLGYFASNIPSLTGGKSGDTQENKDSTFMAYSEATRQEGLVQLTDIFPTILKELHSSHLNKLATVGSPITYVSWKGEGTAKIIGDYQRASLVRPLVGPFYLTNIALFCLVIVLYFSRRHLKNPQFFVQIATWTASIPVASLLVNLLAWWEMKNSTGTLVAGITVIAAVISGLALHVRRRYRYGHIAVVAGVTTATLALDVLLDSFLPGYPLQLGSFMGAQPQVGGRFYGFSNGTFTLFATGLLLLLVLLGNWMKERRKMSHPSTRSDVVQGGGEEEICTVASNEELCNIGKRCLERSDSNPHGGFEGSGPTPPESVETGENERICVELEGNTRRKNDEGKPAENGTSFSPHASCRTRRWLIPVIIFSIGLLAAFLDGSAAFGADFGGPPVIVVGTGIFMMIYGGVRITVPRVCGVVFSALAFSFIFAYFDFLRDPMRRSHLGRFVQSIVEGNPWGVVTRKISQVGLGLPWPVVLLLGCVATGVLIWVWYRRDIRGRVYSWFGEVADMPPGRACVLGLGLALTVGMLINDSGVLFPAVGAMLALPLWCVEMSMGDEEDSSSREKHTVHGSGRTS